ncbi:MAG: histidine phosphatase family protein [Pseudomonadota bacterium]
MASTFRYLTHPQVLIDPSVLVPDWGLSQTGLKRALAFKKSAVLQDTKSVFSSGERKARETADVLASEIGVEVVIRERTHENDRSATGFLKPSEFETIADQFFAKPYESVRGWEKAVDAQSRIIQETEQIFRDAPEGDILMVGHGGVGTLLLCYFSGHDIDRKYDQVGGGGNLFALDLETRRVVHSWVPMERV